MQISNSSSLVQNSAKHSIHSQTVIQSDLFRKIKHTLDLENAKYILGLTVFFNFCVRSAFYECYYVYI